MSPQQSIAHYRIISKLGEGGMGAVYCALDTKLNREVAIKVLPDALASDADYLARFTREAQVLAALNHPNIAILHSVEDRALVMELVLGPTLEERVAAGPLPLGQALPIARQIAEALEAAHEKGITHRDLKPANIKVTPGGVVKVLDFGLAKTADPAPASASSTNSPTLTMRATQAGVIMGTAAYMAPEQAASKPVDRRADIWSFGVVLYESLTGQRLFAGETISHTLADVLRAPVDFTRLPESTPAPIIELLKRCLDRDLKSRLQSIGEARIAIQKVIADPQSAAPPQPAGVHATSRLPWAIAALAVIIAAAASWFGFRANRPQEPKTLVRFDVDLGPDAVRGSRLTAVISPDGKHLVFPGRAPNGGTQLYIRRLDQLSAVPLSGSAVKQSVPNYTPLFSPDSQWVAFNADGKTKKVAVDGGTAIPIGDFPATWGGSWADDGNLYLGSYTGIYRLPSTGGTPEPVKPGMGIAYFPHVLPGSRAILFDRGSNSTSGIGFDLLALDLRTGVVKTLVPRGFWSSYLPATGHLIFLQDRTLFAVAFDPERLELRGSPTPVVQDVDIGSDPISGGGEYSVSSAGTFVYMSGLSEDGFPILWLDPSGNTQPLLAQPAGYGVPRMSPDGKYLAYTAANNIWIYNLQRDTPIQLTFSAPGDWELAWAPDSRHIVYGDVTSLWWIRIDGSDQPQKLADNLSRPRPTSIAPNGRLAFSNSNGSIPDIYTLALDLGDPEHPKPGKPEPFLADPAIVEVDAAFSPDGRFMAYSSTESGPNEIFVRAFPGPAGKWRISVGKFAAWSRTTHELFFLGPDDHIMVLDYSIEGAGFNAGKPRVWSPNPIRRTSVIQNFDISPDGKRAVIFPHPTADDTQRSLHATVLLNFFDELRLRVK
jgi:serine/threonine-protein kinase